MCQFVLTPGSKVTSDTIQSNESADETYLLTQTPPLKLLLEVDFLPLGKMEFTIAVVSIFCAFALALSKMKYANAIVLMLTILFYFITNIFYLPVFLDFLL